MKLAAYILLTDYSDYTQEQAAENHAMTKGVWLIKFLWKVKKLNSLKPRVDSLLNSTLSLLKMICKSRTTRQIMIFLQLFRKYVKSNDFPNVGSYFEVFARDFESLFKVYSFSAIKNKLSREMKTRIHAIRQINKQEREEENKRLQSESGSEESSEENDEEQEMQAKRKEETEEEEVLDKDDRVVPALLNTHLALPLDLYLLKMVFSQTKNFSIQNKAIDIFLDNLAQRKYLVEEILKIELIISKDDHGLYNEYKDHVSRVHKLVKYITNDDYEYLILKNQDKERYKNRVRDTTIVIRNLKTALKFLYYNEGTGYKSGITMSYYEKKDLDKISRAHKIQNIMRQLGMHELMIDSMKQIYYRHNDHSQLYKAILEYLRSF